ncbi:MAG: AAA family ATPase [Bacteroidales bacterium]|nr:AAA family ATPase [Bacteroidales bacterium]
MNEKVFAYGTAVEGENFTDREKETRRLVLNFENGINTILISPRRMGKTSLVKKAIASLPDTSAVIPVYLDVYDCRTEYDFYNKLAAAVIQQSSTKVEHWLEMARTFLSRITPKISFGTEPGGEYSLSLGLSPANHTPEEILQLPEEVAKRRGKRLVICIDEFQQIGELTESLTIQKRFRGVWQHQQSCSYCLFGSKRHLMTNLFQNKRMPFYMFGEMMILEKIPIGEWVLYIQRRFESRGKTISKALCEKICEVTECYSSYVQQLAWNVYAETDYEADAQAYEAGLEALKAQTSALFQQQINSLSGYHLNFLRAIAQGVNRGFTRQEILSQYSIGSKSNVARLQSSLIEKELIEERSDGLYLADPLFALWFRSNCL